MAEIYFRETKSAQSNLSIGRKHFEFKLSRDLYERTKYGLARMNIVGLAKLSAGDFGEIAIEESPRAKICPLAVILKRCRYKKFVG